jgi:hypothetical protein
VPTSPPTPGTSYFVLSDLKFLYRGFRDATFALFTANTLAESTQPSNKSTAPPPDVSNPSIAVKVYNDPKIVTPLLECWKFSIIYIIGLCVLDYILEPLLIHQISHQPSLSVLSYVMQATKLIGWHIPLFLALSVGPGLWYTKINKLYEKVYHMEAQNARISRAGIQIMIERALYKTLALLLVNSLASVIVFIPWVGFTLAFLVNAWIYAFYSFESVLSYALKNNIHNSLSYVERRWMYFLGFGIPSSIIGFAFSFYLGFGIWTIYHPLTLVLAVFANRPKVREVEHIKPLPIFAPIRFLLSLGHPRNWFSKTPEKTEKNE